MKCQILFSGKNKKNISKYRLLKILPRVLSVKSTSPTGHSRVVPLLKFFLCALVASYVAFFCSSSLLFLVPR